VFAHHVRPGVALPSSVGYCPQSLGSCDRATRSRVTLGVPMSCAGASKRPDLRGPGTCLVAPTASRPGHRLGVSRWKRKSGGQARGSCRSGDTLNAPDAGGHPVSQPSAWCAGRGRCQESYPSNVPQVQNQMKTRTYGKKARTPQFKTPSKLLTAVKGLDEWPVSERTHPSQSLYNDTNRAY